MKDVANQNILLIFFTLDTFQLLSGWLKEVAPENILSIKSTLDTFQLLSGWLKELASLNILYTSVTLDTGPLHTHVCPNSYPYMRTSEIAPACASAYVGRSRGVNGSSSTSTFN